MSDAWAAGAAGKVQSMFSADKWSKPCRCPAPAAFYTCLCTIGSESVPKIITDNAENLFLKTAIRILLISNHNHNCFRVLFDKIASVYAI